jgi:hypothetical protein
MHRLQCMGMRQVAPERAYDEWDDLDLPDVEPMGALPLTAQLWPPLRLQAYLEVSH